MAEPQKTLSLLPNRKIALVGRHEQRLEKQRKQGLSRGRCLLPSCDTRGMAGLHVTCLREGSGVRGRVRKWLLAPAISRQRCGVGVGMRTAIISQGTKQNKRERMYYLVRRHLI